MARICSRACWCRKQRTFQLGIDSFSQTVQRTRRAESVTSGAQRHDRQCHTNGSHCQASLSAHSSRRRPLTWTSRRHMALCRCRRSTCFPDKSNDTHTHTHTHTLSLSLSLSPAPTCNQSTFSTHTRESTLSRVLRGQYSRAQTGMPAAKQRGISD